MSKQAELEMAKSKNLRDELSAEAFEITQNAGTERAYTGKYWDTKTPGIYACVCCGESLFDAETKYDSGSGWPSFFAPLNESAVKTRSDTSLGAERTEILCAACDAHLGHVFPDGPQPTGLRFCMNSASLHLNESD